MIPLNIPSLEYGNTLFVGVGGGYDIYGSIPLIETIPGNHVLVSYGSAKDFIVRKATDADFPSSALIGHYNDIYVLGRNGVKTVTKGLQDIIDFHDIDCIVGIDGGVDSLMHGDEANSGTILEDFIVMAAIESLPIKNKYLVNIGFGAEAEEGIEQSTVFKNIAELSDCFLGSCSLTKSHSPYSPYQIYKRLCELAWQQGRKSHIQSRIIAAVEGNYGNYVIDGIDARLTVAETTADISALMSIYWFFEFNGVIAKNKIIPLLKHSSTFTDALSLYRNYLSECHDNQSCMVNA